MKHPILFAKEPMEIEIAPGKTIVPLPPDAIEHVVIADLQPAGDGTYRPVARLARRWIINSAPNLKRYGIPLSSSSVKRLIRAGFIVGSKSTPKLYQFDYYSYLRHLEACKDPEFWDDRRRKIWQQSI